MNTTKMLRTAVLALCVGVAGRSADQTYTKFSQQRDLARAGEQAESQGHYKAAAKAYRRSALYAVDNRTRANLLLREAECFAQGRKPQDAFEAYERLLASYPLHVPYDRVLPRLRELAADFERGVRWLGVRIRNRTKAIEVYELILQETPVGSGAMQDSVNLGALLTATERLDEAIAVYREALKRFPGDPLVPRLRLELGRLLVEASRSGDGDGQVARQAARELQPLAKSATDETSRADAQFLLKLLDERRADALYGLGRFYLRPAHRRELAARRYLQAAGRDFPQTSAGAQAETLLASLGPAPVEPEFPPAVAVAAAVAPADTASAPGGPPPGAKAPPRRRLDGWLPGRSRDEGEPRTLRTLQEREKVDKWLLPLDDLNQTKAGGGSR